MGLQWYITQRDKVKMSITTAITENSISSGAKWGHEAGKIIGQLLGSAIGIGVGYPVGAAVGAYHKVAITLDNRTVDRVNRAGMWIADQVFNHGKEINSLSREFAEHFSGFTASTPNPVGRARYTAELHFFEDHVINGIGPAVGKMVEQHRQGLPVNPKPEYNVYIRSGAIQGAKHASNVAVAALKPTLGLVGGTLGVGLGATWELAKGIAVVLGFGRNKIRDLKRINWVVQNIRNSPRFMDKAEREQNAEFVDAFAPERGFATTNRWRTAQQTEAEWFDTHYRDIYRQTRNMMASERLHRMKTAAKSNPQRPSSTIHPQSTDIVTTYKDITEEIFIPMRKFNELVQMAPDTTDTNGLFEEFIKEGVDIALDDGDPEDISEGKDPKVDSKLRAWIVDQVENTDRSHDDIRDEFIKKNGKDKAKLFDQIVAEIVN